MTKSVMAGGFVQDSWSIMDHGHPQRWAALRRAVHVRRRRQSIAQPSQRMVAARGSHLRSHARGSREVFANYARYYEAVPLDIVDRLGTGEPYIASVYDPTTCDPRDPARPCNSNANRVAAGSAPNQLWIATRRWQDSHRSRPQAAVFRRARARRRVRDHAQRPAGPLYTKRWMNNAIEDMSRDEGTTFFIGNPGSGIAEDFPKAERNYDAVTLYSKRSSPTSGWHRRATPSRTCAATTPACFVPKTGSSTPTATPTSTSDRSPSTAGSAAVRPDPLDQALRSQRLEPRRRQRRDDRHRACARTPGEPTSYLGAHPISGYGFDQVFILPRGEGDRLPWVYSADLRFGYGYHFAKDKTVEATIDIFNIFNFQGETARDQRYTPSPVQPVTNGGGIAQVKNADGSAFSGQTNANFKNPTEYQPPRIFRFGLRTTF